MRKKIIRGEVEFDEEELKSTKFQSVDTQKFPHVTYANNGVLIVGFGEDSKEGIEFIV